VAHPVSLVGSPCRSARRLAGRTLLVQLRANPALSEGRTSREYVVHVPAGYAGMVPTPLVLYFHGAGGNAVGADADSGWSQLADRDRFLVVYPQGLPFGQGGPAAWASAGPTEYDIDDLSFVRAVVAQVERRFCVARGAVFATGMSSGGGMAGYVACALSGQVAAAAPVAGNHYTLTKLGCRPRRRVALLEIHGTADPVVPYNGTPATVDPIWPLPPIPTWVSVWAHLNGCRPDPAEATVAGHETLFTYRRCAPGAGVELYRLDGGGHTYPTSLGGQPTDAVIYHYFMAHTRS
jgi:polyhydroxybutyrate depolymerase